ncbi:unnamed protein product [Caenorhabditis brenneri]
MVKVAVCVFMLVLVSSTQSLSCYIGEQEVAEPQTGFNSCISVLDLATFDIHYEGVISSMFNGTVEDGEEDENNRYCVLRVVRGKKIAVKCFCNTNKCNKLLNIQEFGNELNHTMGNSSTPSSF